MKSLDILLALIREGLYLEKADYDWVVGLSSCKDVDWQQAYVVASQQGMGAVAFDGLKAWMSIPEFKQRFPKPILFQWGSSTMKVEDLYAKQWKSALLLSNLYHENDIRTAVLKGFAVAQYYPQPNHRACGDLDCFLFDDYEKGNELVAQKGVKVDYDFYKHSEFDIKGLHVENHHFCTAIRGSRKAKDFEHLLQNILKENECLPIENSHLLCPPPLFNALFLTKHALGHFLSEGITLRHICDWAIFVHTHYDNLDWDEYVRICTQYGLLRFADAITALGVRLFKIKSPFDLVSGVYVQTLILEDTFSLQDKQRVQEGNSWYVRLKLIANILHDRWKFKYFSDETYMQTLMRLVRGYLFDREPKL